MGINRMLMSGLVQIWSYFCISFEWDVKVWVEIQFKHGNVDISIEIYIINVSEANAPTFKTYYPS